MTEDAQLLERYASEKSEAAFAELTGRHVNLVYSAALRLVHGDGASAQDVTQQVFTELARQAKILAHHPALVGWLYTTTRQMALRANRTEQRRRTREQEAAIMNELQNNDTPPDWSRIGPVLESAMHELDEKERHVILLRFFQNKSLQEVGQELNLSENAARMRVSRALDRLGEKLKQRGITATAMALGEVVSAHAVQLAPGGLAGVVSSAAMAGSGAAHASGLITSIQTIVMTTTQKIIVAAALALAAGTGFYAMRQQTKLTAQIQALQQAQAPINAQMAQLQSQRDQTAQQLAALQAENARLKSNEMELARVRSKVGALRSELAASANSASAEPSTGLAKMLNDPAMKDYLRQAQTTKLRSMYADFFQEMKMTPEQTQKFLDLMVAAAGNGMAKFTGDSTASSQSPADLHTQMVQLLGEDGYAAFGAYSQEIPGRTIVSDLSAQTGASPLSDDQKAALIKIITAEPSDLTRGVTGAPDPAFLGSQADIDNFMQQVDQSDQHILQQAGSLLSSDQLAALNTVLTNALNARRLTGAALIQKH